MRELLGKKVLSLRPGAVSEGESVAFPVVFPAFGRWTEIRFVQVPNKISVPVRNYAGMVENLGRLLRARKAAAAYHEKVAEAVRLRAAAATTRGKAAPKPEYVLVGYVRNEISAGKYGIRLVEYALAGKYRTFYVRKLGRTRAELRSIGSGTIAELITDGYRPGQGDGVYVRPKANDTQGGQGGQNPR